MTCREKKMETEKRRGNVAQREKRVKDPSSLYSSRRTSVETFRNA
jgi:hypothetical protein